MTPTGIETLTREFNGLKDQIERKRVSIAKEIARLKDVQLSYEEDIKRFQELHRDLELDGVVIETPTQ